MRPEVTGPPTAGTFPGGAATAFGRRIRKRLLKPPLKGAFSRPVTADRIFRDLPRDTRPLRAAECRTAHASPPKRGRLFICGRSLFRAFAGGTSSAGRLRSRGTADLTRLQPLQVDLRKTCVDQPGQIGGQARLAQQHPADPHAAAQPEPPGKKFEIESRRTDYEPHALGVVEMVLAARTGIVRLLHNTMVLSVRPENTNADYCYLLREGSGKPWQSKHI